jgi:hypothetical protein
MTKLAIARPLGQLKHLARQPHALLTPVRSPRHHVAGVQRHRQQPGLADPMRAIERLAAGALAPDAIGLVGQLDGQPREQPDAQLGMIVADRVQRLLEPGDQPEVGAEDRDARAAARSVGRYRLVSRMMGEGWCVERW